MSQPASDRNPSLPRNVKVLGLTSLLNDIASEMIYPLLPYFLITVLQGNKVWLGIIEGAADSIASLLKLWAGGRSDQAGSRKGFVLTGYLMTTLSRPLIGVIVAPWQLFLIRITDRLGKGIRTAPRDALIADAADPKIRGRAFGFHRAMDHVGAAVGPLLMAGLLLMWPNALETIFLWTIVPGLAVIVLLVFGLRETPATTPPKEKLKLSLAPFDRNFKLYLVALVVFTLGNSSDAFLLVRAGELGVPKELLPVLWCVFHVVKSAGNFTLGYAVDRFGPRPFLMGGWLFYAAVYLAFGLVTEETGAWTPGVFFLGYAIFYSLTEPAEKTFVANLVGAERKGLAYGWYNFAIGIATLPASLIFGFLYHRFESAMVAFGWSAVLAIAAVLILTMVRNQAKKSEAEK
jgi:sugar phosphate permease